MNRNDPPEDLFAGKYRLVKMLGRGAMGEVWLANEEGPRNFSRQVAVKRLLSTEGMSDIARQSFVAEAQALAHLDHPNIVRLIELGESDDRGLYLVLDFVDGAALDKIMKRTGPMPPATVALIGREVAKALDAVHSLSDDSGRNLGVVHRDVSPANILIGRDGRIRLSDFGVARITGLGGEKTETGIFKGKLPYMPPEQALGEPFDGRADLFSLGVTLYETLIGGRLRKAETQGQLIARIATERAPYVHERSPETPPELARAIDLTTEFRSENRVPDAGQFALMLHQVLYALGPRSEEEAVNDLRDRVATTTSTAAPQSRTPWSLALSGENPAYGSQPHASPSQPYGGQVHAPGAADRSYPSGAFNDSVRRAAMGDRMTPSSPSSAGMATASTIGGTGSHMIAQPGTAQSISVSPPSGSPPSVPSITDTTGQKARGAPWLWVVLAAVVGGAVAIGLWFFLDKGRSSDGDKQGAIAAQSNGGPTGDSTVKSGPSTPDASGAVSPPPKTAATADTPPSSDASTSPTSSTKPHGTLPPNVPHPAATPTESADDSGAPGMIQVVCSPWGNVSIDGRSVGMTPIGAVSVPPGTHTVSATNSDLGASRAQTIKVSSGKTAFVKFDFKKAGE